MTNGPAALAFNTGSAVTSGERRLPLRFAFGELRIIAGQLLPLAHASVCAQQTHVAHPAFALLLLPGAPFPAGRQRGAPFASFSMGTRAPAAPLSSLAAATRAAPADSSEESAGISGEGGEGSSSESGDDTASQVDLQFLQRWAAPLHVARPP